MDAYVRAVNISSARFSPPIAKDVLPERRAFIAELAFELLKHAIATPGHELPRAGTGAAVDLVRDRIAELGPYPKATIADPTDVELSETRRLLANLLKFVEERQPLRIELSPEIAGCGVIDRCAADILLEYEVPWLPEPVLRLYEVKVVDRSFRAIDFRQLLTYAALMLAQERRPSVVGLVNPRLGIYVECDVDELTMDTAGVPASELLDRIVFEVTAGEVSL